jgi:predicted RNase H-like HicB family nuclease
MDDFEVVIRHNEDRGGYIASVPDLRWCSPEPRPTRREALEEAENAATEAMRRWREDPTRLELPPVEVDYCERLVAFVDILGYKNLVRAASGVAERYVETIDRHLRYSLRASGYCPHAHLAVNYVADAICVSCPPDYPGMMLKVLASLQAHFVLGTGWFLRGGLTLGRHYQNDIVLFSEGGVRAYELENRTELPCIAITDDVVDRASLGPDLVDCIDGRQYMMLCDECRFVDYLQVVVENDKLRSAMEADPQPASELGYHPSDVAHEYGLAKHKEVILHNWKAHSGDPKTAAKCRWLAAYHNWKIGQLDVQGASQREQPLTAVLDTASIEIPDFCSLCDETE